MAEISHLFTDLTGQNPKNAGRLRVVRWTFELVGAPVIDDDGIEISPMSVLSAGDERLLDGGWTVDLTPNTGNLAGTYYRVTSAWGTRNFVVPDDDPHDLADLLIDPPADARRVWIAADEAAMLALAASPGDVAVRTDFDPYRTYILAEAPATDLSHWVQVVLDGTGAAPVPGPTPVQNPLTGKWHVAGVTTNDSGDNSTLLQAFIDAAAAAGGGEVVLPAGTIRGEVIIKHRVSLRGTAEGTTILKAVSGSANAGVIQFPVGPAQFVWFHDMSIVGNGNAGQHGTYAKAQPLAPDNNGGWWQGGMRNVVISGFTGGGDCVRLDATANTGLLPHQFLTFDNVWFASTAAGRGLTVTDATQAGQLRFTGGCLFDAGATPSTGTNQGNVYLGIGCYAIEFAGASFQSNLKGITANGVRALTLDSCYFEELGKAVTIVGGTASATILNPTFADAGYVSAGDPSGYLVASSDNASTVIVGGDSVGACSTGFVRGASSTLTVDPAFQWLANPTVAISSNGYDQVNVPAGGGAITLTSGTSLALVNTSTDAVTGISGNHPSPGERVTIIAFGGTVKLSASTAMSLSGRKALTLPPLGAATFAWVDLGQWALVGLSFNADVVTPEQYGATGDGATDDLAALTAALAAAASTGVPLLLAREYAVSAPLTVLPGVRIQGHGGYKRTTDTAAVINRSIIRPTAAFAGDSLMKIGATAGGAANPHGTIIDGINILGVTSGGGQPANVAGIYIRDTLDVRILNTTVAGIDRPGNTGRGIVVEGSGTNLALGTTIHDTLISECFEGILVIGAGATDQRFSDLLVTGCTRGVSLGIDDRSGSTVQAGGGGTQWVNSHVTYAGMPSGGWHLQTGSQAGDCVVTNVYFDQGGNTYPIRVGNARIVLTACHFLPSASNAREGLIRCTVGGSQQLGVVGCNANLNGSSVQSLVWYSAKAGTPTGGAITGNVIYGAPGAAWLGVAIDSAKAVIANQDTGTFALGLNSVCP